MKFFSVINRYGKDNGDPYAHLGSIYGPYDANEDVVGAISRLWPDKQSVEAIILEGSIVFVNTLTREQSSQNGRYVRENGEWKCGDCGVGLDGAVVVVNSADGEPASTVVLYCPNCEEKPPRELVASLG